MRDLADGRVQGSATRTGCIQIRMPMETAGAHGAHGPRDGERRATPGIGGQTQAAFWVFSGLPCWVRQVPLRDWAAAAAG